MPCDDCIIASEHPLVYAPLHVVNPHTGKPGVYDPWGLAICGNDGCKAVWHRAGNQRAALLGVLP